MVAISGGYVCRLPVVVDQERGKRRGLNNASSDMRDAASMAPFCIVWEMLHTHAGFAQDRTRGIFFIQYCYVSWSYQSKTNLSFCSLDEHMIYIICLKNFE
jgi:hypothetical protein